MSGGNNTQVSMAHSPQQQQVFGAMMPQLMGGFGQSIYDLPSAQGLTPSADWYQNISPEVMAGIRRPWEQQGQQLMETMGFRGMGGSPRAGMSGSAGVAAGTFAEEAGRNIGMQAWQMTAPGAQMQYQAELGRNIAGYQRPFQEAQLAAGLIPGTYPQPIVQPGQQGQGGALGSLAGMGLGAGLGALLAAPTGGLSMLAGAGLGAGFGMGAGGLLGSLY